MEKYELWLDQLNIFLERKMFFLQVKKFYVQFLGYSVFQETNLIEFNNLWKKYKLWLD